MPTFSIRCSEEQRCSLATAAGRAATPLQGFVLDVALAEAERVNAQDPKPCETLAWFTEACAAATAGGQGYRRVGQLLAERLPGLLQGPDADERLEELRALFAAGDARQARLWLRHELPEFVAVVPSGRRKALLAGIRDGWVAGALG